MNEKLIPLYIRRYNSKDSFDWKIIFVEERNGLYFISNYNNYLDEKRNDNKSYSEKIIYEVHKNTSDVINWSYLTFKYDLGIIEEIDKDVIRTLKEL